MGVQALTRGVAGSNTWRCRLQHVALQALTRGVAGSNPWGCRLWHVGQRRALLARAEACMAAAVIGSRRQPMVPIALVSGHSGSVFIALVRVRVRLRVRVKPRLG